MLEGDDPGDGTFALFLRPQPRAFRQLILICPHPGEFANDLGLAPGGWALLELTDALSSSATRGG